MKKNLIINFKSSSFQNFLDKIQDLTTIEDVLKIKINKDFIIIYSILGNEGQVSAMKSYTLITSDYLENYKEEETYDLVVVSAVKFVKNLKFFDTSKPIKIEISAKSLPDSDDIMQIRTINFTNGKLKITSIGAENHKIRDLNKKFIDTKLDVKKSRWNFEVNVEDFTNIKKLSQINSEDKIMNINVLNKKVFFNETSKWELEVDEIDVPNQNFILNKKYLSFINKENENITFNIFDNFILIKDNDSSLMLSFEQDFSNDN